MRQTAYPFVVLALGLAARIAMTHPAMAEPPSDRTGAPLGGNVITVTITADEYDTSGAGAGCSLREAVQSVNSAANFGGCSRVADGSVTGEQIRVPKGFPIGVTYVLTRVGIDDLNVAGDIDVRADVAIVSSGTKGSATVDASATNDRVLNVIGDTSVELAGLTLTGGDTTGSGGGIDASASGSALTLRDVTVRNSHASGSGGGIEALGSLTLTNSTVKDNLADAVTSVGGGIKGQFVTVLSSTIENNRAGGQGGGIHANTGLVLVASLVVSNATLSAASTGLGGGLFMQTGIVDRSLISGNVAASNGGGAFVTGDATILNTTVANNLAKGGGGGLLRQNGTVTLVNTTIADNRANLDGGGMYVLTGQAAFFNVTLASNVADADANSTGVGGGLKSVPVASFAITLANTLIGDNTLGGGGADDCAGAVTSLGYNLIEATSGCSITGTLTGNITGADPALGLLADNGGLQAGDAALSRIPTRLPFARSPAVDGGNPTGCVDGTGSPLLTDERGVSRPQDGNADGLAHCDIGAAELVLQRVFVPNARRDGSSAW